jgi:hypothetical protein
LALSDPTDGASPLGVSWNVINDFASIGESAPYGVSFPVQQGYVCYGKCEDALCGRFGSCDAQSNFCACRNGIGGNYCEFSMQHLYVYHLVDYYWDHLNESWFDRKAFEYDKIYWGHWTDDELYEQLAVALELRDAPTTTP